MKRLALFSSVLLLAACGPKESASDDGETEGSDDGGTSADDGDDGDDTGDDGDGAADDGSGDDGTDTGDGGTTTSEPDEPDEPTLARNISIVLVEADSGIATPIMQDGVEIPMASRDTMLPKTRDTMVRLKVETGPGWVTRKIRAELLLKHGDGTETLLKDTHEIDRGYYLDDLTCFADLCDPFSAEMFFFGVEAAVMLPDLEWSVSLWEAETGQEDEPEPDPPPVFPADGSTVPLGVDPTYLDMELVMVPIEYTRASDYPNCDGIPDTSDANMQRYVDHITQLNPLESFTLTVREPLTWTQSVTSANGLSSLVGAMAQLRQQEGAEPWVYYYGLLDNCGACIANPPGCIVGMAGGSMAAVGLIVPGPSTFTHEVGHLQGRAHVACPVSSAGPDPTYPYEDGLIDDWGFGIRDFGMRKAGEAYDYMSYCGPAWVSDWQWNHTYDRIEELSAMKGGAAAIPEGFELVGVIEPDGGQSWWVERKIRRDATPSTTETVQFVAGDSVVATPEVWTALRHDHPAKEIFVDLPAGFDLGVTTVVYNDGATQHTVPVDQIIRPVR
jgi:hypothetical protein